MRRAVSQSDSGTTLFVCSKERASEERGKGSGFGLKNELSSDYNAHASLSVGCRIFNDAIMSPTHRNVSSRFD